MRREAGREPTPRAVGIARPLVQTRARGGKARGDAGGKQITGRTRHVLVETLGGLLAVVRTSARMEEGGAAIAWLTPVSAQNCPRLETICGDTTSHHPALAQWLAKHRPGWPMAVKARPAGTPGFTPVRNRWGVERTKAWNGRARRHSNDYERKPESAAAMIQLSNLHLMLRNLAPSAQRAFRSAAAA